MTRSGVSPLIAVVLLIAFTMAVAAILTAWVTTFVSDTTGDLENQSEEQIDCSFANIEIFETNRGGSSSGNYWASVVVTNVGTQEFTNTSITALRDGSIVDTGFIENLGSGTTTDLNMTGMEDEPTRIRVVPEDCPGISVDETL